MKELESFASHGGVQKVFSHYSEVNKCDMKFAIFFPSMDTKKEFSVVWYLSGLTCSHANVMEKGEYRRKAAELGLVVVCPDTSPRGENVPDDKDDWQFGFGAGFYIDAMVKPYSENYNMFSYISDELPSLIKSNFSVNINQQGIMGHSMGGHGALILALNFPEKYKSCSAFAPIVQPTTADWSIKAYERYLGKDENAWRKYDATRLIEDGARFPNILVDQGKKDPFLHDGLRPEILEEICHKFNQPLTLRIHDDYDHSYYFISTFMNDHLDWHNEIINN